jgi:hypothetical protein
MALPTYDTEVFSRENTPCSARTSWLAALGAGVTGRKGAGIEDIEGSK